MPNAQCPMPNAQCPMTRLCFKSAEPTAGATTGGKYATHCLPNALAPPCPMPNARCPMPNAQCPMPNAQCPIRHFY
ncbi:MAG: hypothetical protein KME31_17000 [Tolypothrix carrinoi HA7290-LM1]|nr:hypothetical protein [Tolypothrix carrinoi HA7290-LM1]